jgi:hypothetical protein
MGGQGPQSRERTVMMAGILRMSQWFPNPTSVMWSAGASSGITSVCTSAAEGAHERDLIRLLLPRPGKDPGRLLALIRQPPGPLFIIYQYYRCNLGINRYMEFWFPLSAPAGPWKPSGKTPGPD